MSESLVPMYTRRTSRAKKRGRPWGSGRGTIADPFEDEGWREALLYYGVDTFATRNVKDFADAGFPTLIDPFL